jgi:hypothetical protein
MCVSLSLWLSLSWFHPVPDSCGNVSYHEMNITHAQSRIVMDLAPIRAT